MFICAYVMLMEVNLLEAPCSQQQHVKPIGFCVAGAGPLFTAVCGQQLDPLKISPTDVAQQVFGLQDPTPRAEPSWTLAPSFSSAWMLTRKDEFKSWKCTSPLA